MSDRAEAGMYWRKPRKVFACNISDIIKQPTLDPEKKEHLPAWVRESFNHRLIECEFYEGLWVLNVITRTAGRQLARRTEWLLLNPDDMPDGLSIVDNSTFQERFVRAGEPLTERERRLEEDLKGVRTSTTPTREEERRRAAALRRREGKTAI